MREGGLVERQRGVGDASHSATDLAGTRSSLSFEGNSRRAQRWKSEGAFDLRLWKELFVLAASKQGEHGAGAGCAASGLPRLRSSTARVFSQSVSTRKLSEERPLGMREAAEGLRRPLAGEACLRRRSRPPR